MIKLITWSLVRDDTYSKIYTDLEDNGNESTSQQQSTSSNFNIPTLLIIACKVAQVEDLKLDEKQYITYEIICCTFLLDLVNDGGDTSTAMTMTMTTTTATTTTTPTMTITTIGVDLASLYIQWYHTY